GQDLLENSPETQELTHGAKYLMTNAKKLSGNFAWGEIMAPGARIRML
ncbi:hypothetical protein A2U01_0115529, partial [Trifolium medium]|nr:hypothetical protein [Trifolium medium]